MVHPSFAARVRELYRNRHSNPRVADIYARDIRRLLPRLIRRYQRPTSALLWHLLRKDNRLQVHLDRILRREHRNLHGPLLRYATRVARTNLLAITRR